MTTFKSTILTVQITTLYTFNICLRLVVYFIISTIATYTYYTSLGMTDGYHISK